MRNFKLGAGLIVLSCWTMTALAGVASGVAATEPAAADAVAAVSGVPAQSAPASAVAPAKTEAAPEADYQAGLEAYKRGEPAKAQALFERAANNGHAGAMVRLAWMLDKAGASKESLHWNIKAAGLGNADAQYTVGRLYSDSSVYGAAREGVNVDPAIAYKWFRMAAEGGNKPAIALMAQAYVSGGEKMGIKDADRTDAEILKWINLDISANNSAASMRTLAHAYREGKYGLTADAKQAREWDAKARAASKPRKSAEKKKHAED